MKTGKWILTGVLLGAVMLSANAQDTLWTVNGEVSTAKVESLGNRRLRMSNFSANPSVTRMPITYLTKVRFADGFEVPVQNGKPVWENLWACPNLRYDGLTFKAEGMFPLEPEDIHRYLGDRHYYLGYLPVRTRGYAGLGEVIAGLLGYASLLAFNADGAWANTAAMTSIGLLFSGGIGLFQAEGQMRNVLYWHEGKTYLSPARSRVQMGIGLGMMAAGAGLIGWGGYLLAQDPDRFTLLGMAGGALAGLGLSEFLVGHVRLKSYKNLPAAEVQLGAASHGYGLTVSF